MAQLKQEILKVHNYISSIVSNLFKKRTKAKIYTSLTIVVDSKTFKLEVDEKSLQLLREAMGKDFTNTNISLMELILAYVSRTIS